MATPAANPHRIKRSRADMIFDLAVLAIMTLVLLVSIYPLYFILIASVSDPSMVLTGKVLFAPSGFNLNGYVRIFSQQKIWMGYANTLYYTVLGTTVNVVFTVMAGYSLSRRDLPARRMLLKLFIFTLFFNGGMIPTYMVVKGLDLVDTTWAMVLPNAIQVWNLMIARNYFETNIPDELLDAAMIDGCRTLRFFGQIVLPLSKAIVAVMVLFYAISHWNAFFNALIYLESESKYPLQIILRNILIANQADAGMVDDIATLVERQKLAEMLKYGVIVVASIPVLVLYPFVQKYFVTGIMVGSIKG